MQTLQKIRNLRKNIFDARIKANDVVESNQLLPQHLQLYDTEEWTAQVSTCAITPMTEPAIASVKTENDDISELTYVIDGDKITYNINLIADRIDKKAESIYKKSGIILGEGTITTTNSNKPAKYYTLIDKYGTTHEITIAFEDCYDYHIYSIIIVDESRYSHSDIKCSDGRLIDCLDASMEEQSKIHNYFKLHFDIPPNDNYTVFEHWENGYRMNDMVDTIISIKAKNRYSEFNQTVDATLSTLLLLKQKYSEKFKIENPNFTDENPYEDNCEVGLARPTCSRCGRRIIVDTEWLQS